MPELRPDPGSRRQRGVGLLALALAALLQSGCVGLMAVAPGTAEVVLEWPTLETPPSTPVHAVSLRRDATTLHAFWGEPDRIEALGPGRARWVYPTQLRLRGVTLWLGIVPVPLLLPTGRHQMEVVVEGGRLAHARGTVPVTAARVGCALAWPEPDGSRWSGCRAQGRGPAPSWARHRRTFLYDGPGPRPETR